MNQTNKLGQILEENLNAKTQNKLPASLHSPEDLVLKIEFVPAVLTLWRRSCIQVEEVVFREIACKEN